MESEKDHSATTIQGTPKPVNPVQNSQFVVTHHDISEKVPETITNHSDCGYDATEGN
jgi:hypothetical protein